MQLLFILVQTTIIEKAISISIHCFYLATLLEVTIVTFSPNKDFRVSIRYITSIHETNAVLTTMFSDI